MARKDLQNSRARTHSVLNSPWHVLRVSPGGTAVSTEASKPSCPSYVLAGMKHSDGDRTIMQKREPLMMWQSFKMMFRDSTML
mmetsp:Transcript_66506/g.125828  ORF Transcript_66506/g.125828 Transcript_66506/m.125828 type:complete len:83 (+) Transcript_66506:908-1156(+)